MLIAAERSILLVIDIQERLLPAMADGEAMLKNTVRLLQGAALMGVPAVISEQNPAGIGHTVDALANEAGGAKILEKSAFSCADESAIRQHV